MPSATTSIRRKALTVIGVLVFGLVAGILVAHFSGRRQAGDEITGTGTIKNTTTQDANACLSDTSSGQMSKAVTCFQKVLDADPTNPTALTYLGWTLVLSSGSLPANTGVEAITAGQNLVNRAIKSDPTFPDAWAFKAIIADQLGQPEVAHQALATLSTLNPPAEITQLVAGLSTKVDKELKAGPTTTTKPGSSPTTAPAAPAANSAPAAPTSYGDRQAVRRTPPRSSAPVSAENATSARPKPAVSPIPLGGVAVRGGPLRGHLGGRAGRLALTGAGVRRAEQAECAPVQIKAAWQAYRAAASCPPSTGSWAQPPACPRPSAATSRRRCRRPASASTSPARSPPAVATTSVTPGSTPTSRSTTWPPTTTPSASSADKRPLAPTVGHVGGGCPGPVLGGWRPLRVGWREGGCRLAVPGGSAAAAGAVAGQPP